MPTGEVIFKKYVLTGAAAAFSVAALLNTTESPRRIVIQNASGAANEFWLGGADVATNAGREVVAAAEFIFENQDPAEIYIIGTVNAANIAYITAEF